ncbi:hypothetical protein MHU86_2478 [Fragilaria crotonensis]|nr:hypothetical protein MHU86_2478 [Fragilaria crotonensis]
MYNKEIRRECEKKEQKLGLIIEIPDNGTTTSRDDISPVTITTINSSLAEGGSDTTITTKKSRQSSRQASIARLDAKRVKLDYDGRYKKAFKDATNLVVANARGEPVNTICNRLNQDFKLDGAKRLARSTVYQAAKDGRAGMSPPSRGPEPNIPGKFLQLVATHAEVSQVGDGELKGKDFKRLIGASILGTEHETRYTVEGVWRKVRKVFPESLQAATKLTVEDARAQWTTHDNLNQWFDDAKQDLINTGLVIDEEVLDEKGAMVSEVLFRKDTERRIINMDETHHDLSITGDRGGPRAVSYHNPAFQRGAARGVKSARHVTGAYATNAAGEALPPFYIFDSSAKLWENFRVKVEWLEGLPLVTGRFGCPTIIESGSFYAVRPRGSMDDSLLNDYIEKVIVPLYPNMHKTAVFDPVTGKLNQGPVILKVDAGPGRIVSSEAILLKREQFFERGLIILLGLPNATSVQQEMDALYGPFKSSTYARGEKVVQQKLRARGLARRNGKVPPAVLNLDFNDLATVVNGTPDDEPRNKPFDSIFTEEKILRSWAKVGFVPFTRNCLKDKKVRKELGQRKADEQLENLQRRYDLLVDSFEGDGFNAGIFDLEIPTAAHVIRAETEDKQAEELVENGKAFSVAGQWNHCQSRIGNAGVTIRAQKMQLELNETARTKVANKKSEAQLKALEKAQIALAKFEFDSHSMNDKDWGDVIRWVLPEAKVEFLLKDLKKKEDILAKLATLPNSWTTYIPRREHTLPAVPTTTV